MTDPAQKIIKVIDLVPGTTLQLPALEVERLDQQTFWHDYVCRHRPLLIKGAVRHWAAIGRWDQPGYLEGIDTPARVWLSRTFNPQQIGVLRKLVQVKKIADCISEMRAADADQTYSIPSVPAPAEWASELGEYPFLPEALAKSPRIYPQRRLFIYRNASTEWHYHPTDETLTTQLSGRKRVSLFRLTRHNWSDCSTVLEANLHHLGCGRQFFPRDLQLTKYDAMIEQGDALYLPPFWWHGVDPADSTLGVTLAHCFRTPWRRYADWRDPATQASLPRRAKEWHRAPGAIGRIALSTLARRIKGEPWREEI